MARTSRLARVLTLAPVALLAMFISTVRAEPVPGVTVTVYNMQGYNNAPPLPDETRAVGTTTDLDVVHSFDQQPLFAMYEDFIVRYQGHITAPTTGDYQFMALADDGTQMYLNGTRIINDWYDKGGGGSVSPTVEMVTGQSQPFTLWYYENGGGAWVELWWNHDQQWEPVPPSAFTVTPQESTTTTEPSTTTTTTSTTTSTTTTTTSTSTTTSTAVPTTTTTQPPTTTTYQEATSTTQPMNVQTTASSSSTTSTSSSTTTTLPTTTTTTSTTTTVPTTTTSTLPEVVAGMPPEQAVAIAVSAAAVAQLEPDQAEAVFDALQLDELSDAEVAAVVAAVQSAPDSVRAVFEQEIDVFAGATDTYIPLGSLVNVATRRVLIVSVAFSVAMPVAPSRRP